MKRWLYNLCLAGTTLALAAGMARAAGRPNVLLVLTDDQGYGDLGFHGNPRIRTPHLDAFARQSAQMQSFHVCPVCSPTRAGLMTGRYNYRTGVVDTYLGRSLMHPDEVTLAEMFAAAGYRTGIFGKWHLGDNYPLRPGDQGFQESLVLKGGGIGQPSDPPGGDSYFDPTLLHNGKPVKTRGYCSDVFTEAALQFIGQDPGRPFFAYLAYNAPHAPLQVPARYLEPYRKRKLSLDDFPRVGRPVAGKFDAEATARVYAMVTNLDDNLGRLLARLDELKRAGDTVVVFLTDNGPAGARFNGGLRGLKGSVYDGGIRVPCFVRWPGKCPAGHKVDRIAAHIDVAPTLLDACGVARPVGVKFDGVSLWPLLQGRRVDWPDRTLYFQWHRGDEPELNRACAARSQRWKLVQPLGAGPGPFAGRPRFELYDMAADPFETADVAEKHADVVGRMRRGYEAWFKDVSGTRGFAPPRIHLGTAHENPTVLTRQDWRGPRAGRGPKGLGHWEVRVARAGTYEVTLRFARAARGASAHFALGGAAVDRPVAEGAADCTLGPVRLGAGPGRLEAWVAAGDEKVGVHYVEVKRLER
jgi:arylsulfatase A-like enzyme